MSIKELRGLDELFDYKNQLIDDLLKSKNVIRLLSDDCKTFKHPEDLVYSQVFPFEYVPDTVEHGQTFICCEVDIRRAMNKTYLMPEIYVWVFTHKSLLRLPEGGVRVDRLCSEISKIINGSRMYGLGELNLRSATRFSPIANYQGRMLTFDAVDWNRLLPTGQRVPANRKRE